MCDGAERRVAVSSDVRPWAIYQDEMLHCGDCYPRDDGVDDIAFPLSFKVRTQEN